MSEWVSTRERVNRCPEVWNYPPPSVPHGWVTAAHCHWVNGQITTATEINLHTWAHTGMAAWSRTHTQTYKVKGGGGRLAPSMRGSEGRGYIFINMPFSLQQHKVLQWLTALCIHYADFKIVLYIKMWDILVLLCSVFLAVKGKMCVLCAD